MKLITNNLKNDILKVSIEGEVDVYTSINLKKELNDLVKAGRKDLIIDLSNVKYMDSSGLGVLVALLKLLKSEQGSLKLVALPLKVRKIFDLTRLTKFFDIYETAEEALN